MQHSQSEIDELVLVVHGVGDPQPGEILSAFVRSLADEDTPLCETQKVNWLHDKNSANDHVQTFPSHSRSLTAGNRSFEFAEVFWGDLSRVRKGWWGILVGLFQILFGIRYAAYVAADQTSRGADRLKQLGLISSRMLHGPVLAVNIFLLIVTLGLSGSQLLWGRESMNAVWMKTLLAGCCGVSILFASVSSLLTKNRIIKRFCFWLMVTACSAGTLLLIRSFILNPMYPALAHHEQVHPCLIWYCRVLVVLLGLLWLSEMIVLAAMAFNWALAMTDPKTHQPAIHLSFLLPAFAVGVWGQAIPMLWVSITVALKNAHQLPEFTVIFHEAIPMLGVQLAMAAIILVATSFVLARYFWWKRTASIQRYLSGSKPPRVIAHPLLQIVLAACTVIGASLVFLLGLLQHFGYDYSEIWGGKFLADINKYALLSIVPLGGFIVLVLPKLRGVIDIILDVVNHFYFRSTRIKDVLDDDDEFDISETTFESGSLYFSRRDAIHYRIKKIMMHYRDRMSHRPELTIVSHSQGTMLAIEVLNDPELTWLNNCFSKVSLVTMGSPFSHLYQHYYSHLYPSLSHKFWQPLYARLAKWTNIFRIDDYVGNEIEFVDRSPTQRRPITFDAMQPPMRLANGDCEQMNIPVGARGHVSYWTDREVLEVLRSKVFVEFSSNPDRPNTSQAA